MRSTASLHTPKENLLPKVAIEADTWVNFDEIENAVYENGDTGANSYITHSLDDTTFSAQRRRVESSDSALRNLRRINLRKRVA